MRLSNYLTETQIPPTSIIKSTIEFINDTTNPEFLTMVKKQKKMLYRGLSVWYPENKAHIVANKNKDRIPKDTPIEIHNGLNKMFNKKFGWNVRNGIFTVSSIHTATYYGVPHCFFPIGNYEYVSSNKIGDLFNSQQTFSKGLKNYIINGVLEETEIKRAYDNEVKFYPNLAYDKFKVRYIRKINREFKSFIDSYSDKNLQFAIQRNCEISFNCDKYILAKIDIEPWFFGPELRIFAKQSPVRVIK